MDFLQNYNARLRKERQQAAAVSSSIIQSSDENPEKIADNLIFAQQYSEVTGCPAPPLPMVKEHRDLFQARIDETRNQQILSTSPRLAQWINRNATVAALAKDDLHNLSQLEKLAQRPLDYLRPTLQPALSASPTVRPSAPDAAPPTESASPPQGPVVPTNMSASMETAPAGAEPVVAPTPPVAPPVQPVTPPAPSPDSPTEPATSATAPTSAPGVTASPSAGPVVPEVSQQAAPSGPPAPQEVLSEDEKQIEQLITDFANSIKLSDEEFEALKEKARTQGLIDPGVAVFYLNAAREGAVSADQLRIYLAAPSSPYRIRDPLQSAVEWPKGVLSNTLTIPGETMQFAGQVLGDSEPPERLALVDKMIRARSLPADSYEAHLIRQEIWKQHWFNPTTGIAAFSALLDGSATEEEIRAQLAPLGKNLKIDGQQLAERATEFFKAAPGYENSFLRRFGETVGDSVLAAVALSLFGLPAGAAAAMMQAGGDGVVAGRKAGLSGDKLTKFALLYAATGGIDSIPAARGVSRVLKFLPLKLLLRNVISDTAEEVAKQVSQKVLQNIIDKQFIDPTKKALDDAVDTSTQAVALGLFNSLGAMTMESLLGRRRSSRSSALQPEAAVQARQTIEDMSNAAKASAFRGNRPEDFHSYAGQALKGTQFEYAYTSTDARARYVTEKGSDPFGLDGSTTLKLAEETGSKLKIPMASYLTNSTGSAHDKALMDSMHFGPDALNYSEALASHIGAPSPSLRPPVKRNGPYKATGYLNDQEIDSYVASHLRNGAPKASEASRFGQAHPAFSSALPKPERVQNSGNTMRNSNGMSVRKLIRGPNGW